MEKINIAEILKDCPMGMELDCAMFGNLEFDHIDEDDPAYSIICRVKNEYGSYNTCNFTKYGCYSTEKYAKCVIFPKGKTTWEGFVPPYNFKKGDVLYVDCTDERDDTQYDYIFILDKICNGRVYSYCWYYIPNDTFRNSDESGTSCLTYDKYPIRLATKEQRDLLFQKMKESGYEWNEETKTLEKMIKSEFKDGDVVACDCRDTGDSQLFIFKEYDDDDYAVCYLFLDTDGTLDVDEFAWIVNRRATEEEKEKLFQALKDNGYKWNPETKTLEVLEDKEDKGNISDGYHTFNELYEYRLLYNASMFNELAKQGLYDVHKSKKHSDGTIPFGDENWFIVQAELPTGQISNHYEMKDWELFNIPEKEKANPYDGHTPKDVAKRLREFLTSEKSIEPEFKDGDVLYVDCTDEDDDKQYDFIFILNKIYNGDVQSYCHYFISDDEFHHRATYLTDDKYPIRYATEEEKETLFQAIKADGYKWNAETKTLEKLVEPKFKVGDRIVHKVNKTSPFTITEVTEQSYKGGTQYEVLIEQQDNFELDYSIKFDVNALKPFDKVLVRTPSCNKKWTVALYSHYDDNKSFTCHYCVCGGLWYAQCIPFNGNEHLLNTTNECDEFYKTW